MMHPNWHEICEALREMLYHDGGYDEHQWQASGIEVSGFAVMPRMDGGFGIYYVHATYATFSVLEQITHERLAAYRNTLAGHNIYTSLQEPTTEGAQQWLLYRPSTTKSAQLETAMVANK